MNTWLKLGRVEHKSLLNKPHIERREENQNKDFPFSTESEKSFPVPSNVLTEKDLPIAFSPIFYFPSII